MEILTPISTVKEKIGSVLTGDRPSLGDSEGLRRWARDLEDGSQRGEEDSILAEGSQRGWRGAGLQTVKTACRGPRGLEGGDCQFDFYPKSTTKVSKGATPGSNMISFVILQDHSSWRTDWQEERVEA